MKSKLNFSILFSLIISVVFLNCKGKIEENTAIIIEEIVTPAINNKEASIDHFLIGKKEILLEDLNSKIAEEPPLITEIFKYYDTINGVASLHFKEIENSQYNLFYKPDISDSRELEDSFFLKSEVGYDFFKIVKEYSFFDKKKILIFEGRSSNEDYDGNLIYTNRKDLVVVDFENNIIDAINIYYNYSDGIFASTKFFYIEQDYYISLRNYGEDEEGKTQFYDIKKYRITKEGNIIGVN